MLMLVLPVVGMFFGADPLTTAMSYDRIPLVVPEAHAKLVCTLRVPRAQAATRLITAESDVQEPRTAAEPPMRDLKRKS